MGQTKRKISARAFDVTSVSALECFGWSVPVCFHVPCLVSAQNEVRWGRRLATPHRGLCNTIEHEARCMRAYVFTSMPARIALFVSQEIASEKKRAQGEK